MSTTTDEAFIKEHGRLRHPVSHSSFDPFRRPATCYPPTILFLNRIFAPLFIPFRLLIALLATLISYILVKAFGPPSHPEAVEIPVWRRQICIFATKLLGRALLFALGFVRVHGTDHPDYNPEKAPRATIITNHSSIADPCLLAYLYAPSFVAKNEVAMIPGIGRVGAAQHALYIERLKSAGVTERLKKRQQEVASGKQIPQVCIFPEGTTTNGHFLLRFRTGAFVAGVPVAPVMIRYRGYFSPTYETIKTGKYVWGMLTGWSQVEYVRLPVYEPSEEERADARVYADRFYEWMLKHGEGWWKGSQSDYVDKMEYHSIVRGGGLKSGLKLNMQT